MALALWKADTFPSCQAADAPIFDRRLLVFALDQTLCCGQVLQVRKLLWPKSTLLQVQQQQRSA